MLGSMLYTNKALFMFDILIDIDLGLINLISEEYNNENYFYQGLFELSKEELQYVLSIRKDYNPLFSIMIDDSNKKEINDLYDDFIQNHYEEILEYVEPTGVFNLLIRFLNSDNVVYPTILCKNKLEAEYLLYFLEEFNISEERYNIEICNDLNDFDTSMYDTLYIKYYTEVLYFLPLEGKNIIIADVNYNKIELNGELVPDPAIGIQIVEHNELRTISLYVLSEDVNGVG